MTWQIVNLKKKQVKPVKVVNYNINAAICNVLTMMQYVRELEQVRIFLTRPTGKFQNQRFFYRKFLFTVQCI